MSWLLSATTILAIAGCSGTSGQTSSPAGPGGTTASGFPIGSFTKDLSDPHMGRVRITWTFGADGRWNELPVALDGQAIEAGPVRGAFSVDGGTLTIATDFPAGMGASTHSWRMDGDRLWTVLQGSDNPDDKGWFESLDSQPWTPAES